MIFSNQINRLQLIFNVDQSIVVNPKGRFIGELENRLIKSYLNLFLRKLTG